MAIIMTQSFHHCSDVVGLRRQINCRNYYIMALVFLFSWPESTGSSVPIRHSLCKTLSKCFDPNCSALWVFYLMVVHALLKEVNFVKIQWHCIVTSCKNSILRSIITGGAFSCFTISGISYGLSTALSSSSSAATPDHDFIVNPIVNLSTVGSHRYNCNLWWGFCRRLIV